MKISKPWGKRALRPWDTIVALMAAVFLVLSASPPSADAEAVTTSPSSGTDTIEPVPTTGSGKSLKGTPALTDRKTCTPKAAVTKPDPSKAIKDSAFTTQKEPTPSPPLIIKPSALKVGKRCTVRIELRENITEDFDSFVFADGPCGPHTIHLDGRVKQGIKPIARNVKGYNAPFTASVTPDYVFPSALQGAPVTFYAVVVQAGKMPPVSSRSDLSATKPHVIMMDKKTVTTAP